MTALVTTTGRYRRPAFDPAAEYVAARPLTWGLSDGTVLTIAGGERFDPQALNCPDWKLQQLYRVCHIAMVLTEDGQPKLRDQAANGVPVAPLPPVAPTAPATATPDASPGRGRHLKSVGFGFYAVLDADGNQLNQKRLTKAEAEALVNAA